MSDYKNIRGKKVKFLTSDLSGEQSEGQIFYSDTNNDFKSVVASAAFSSGGPLITARTWIGATGTQTAALYSGGTIAPSTRFVNTEEYDGTGFSTGGNLNTAKGNSGAAGTQTAGIHAMGNVGGSASDDAEEYNGSSWTNVTDAPTATRDIDAFGTQTAAVFLGGNPEPDHSYEYDGTNWTASNDMGTGRYTSGTAGILTAGLAFGGYSSTANTANTESYNGTSWTEVGNLTVAKRDGASGGIQTAAFFAGGAGTPGGGDTKSDAQQLWDGTSWSNSSATLAVTRRGLRGTGASSSAGIGAGGYTGDNATVGSNATEEFNITVNTITAGAWSSGGNLNTGRTGLAGAGSQTAALAFGGTVATPSTPQNPYKNESEEYNGTSWTEGNNLNQARSGIAGGGTQTAAIGAGGLPGGGASNTANSEEYDGTSWAEGNNLVNASYNRAGAGTQTATILMGGGNYTNPPPSFNFISNTEYYDGTSWSEQNDMNTARYIAAGCGSQTSSLVSGGSASPGTVANVEEWNGTSWSEVNDLLVANQGHALTGLQTAALQAAGYDGSLTAAAFNYNGTSWTTAPSVATARQSLAGGGEGSTQTSSIVFGGTITPAPTGYQQTEEFTGETTALNIKTITTS